MATSETPAPNSPDSTGAKTEAQIAVNQDSGEVTQVYQFVAEILKKDWKERNPVEKIRR